MSKHRLEDPQVVMAGGYDYQVIDDFDSLYVDYETTLEEAKIAVAQWAALVDYLSEVRYAGPHKGRHRAPSFGWTGYCRDVNVLLEEWKKR